MKPFENLQSFASLITQNVAAYMDAFPIESQTAESIHQGIATLIYKHVRIDLEDIGFSTAVTLAFGAHSAWINAFNMTVAGYVDSGWSEIRRAIEFTCYASKVVNSEKRAKAWIRQRTDIESRKTFSGSCHIPMAYVDDKYSYLRELLVTYDMANYYGAHGNLETFAGKYRHNQDNELLFSYQADKSIICLNAGGMILNGYRILQAFKRILNSKLTEVKEFDTLMHYIDNTIINLRIQLAKDNYNGVVPKHIVQFILHDSKEETNRMFNEMIEREKNRKKKEE